MNKLLLSIGAFLTVSASFSQISINLEGQTADLSGASHNITTNVNDENLIDLLIHNNTGATQEWRVTRKKISTPSNWIDYLCWGLQGDPLGGQCYGASQTDPWITPANPTGLNVPNGGAGLLAIHISPSISDGAFSHYRYYIGRTIDNPQDSVDVIFNITAGVKTVTVNTNLSVYPNPVNDLLNVVLASGSQEGNVKIVDVLGKVVFEEKIAASKKISTEDFKNGVYIVSVTSSGVTSTKRIVVKH